MTKIRFGDILYIKGRIGWQALKKEEYLTKGDYYLVTGVDITDEHRINFNNCYFVSKERYEMDDKIQLKENDIIVTKDGTIGKIAVIKNLDKPATLNSHLFLIRNNKPDILDTNFLFYILCSDLFKKYATNNISGSNIPAFTQKNISEFEIEIPAIDKQIKIANTLMNIDNKIINNNKTILELESMAKTIYDYWFLQYEFPNEEGKPYKSSGGKMVYNEELKKEIPEGWKVKEVQDYCNIFTGKKDVNQALDKGKYKFFSCSPDYKYSNDKLYEGKAILISGNGSYTGRTIFVNDSFDLYQRTYACTNNYEKDYMEYIYYSMLKLFVPRVSGGTHGSAIPYIVYNDIAKQQIVMNEIIVGKFTDTIKGCTEKIVNLNKENEELTKLRDELLPLLMNGQVGFKS